MLPRRRPPSEPAPCPGRACTPRKLAVPALDPGMGTGAVGTRCSLLVGVTSDAGVALDTSTPTGTATPSAPASSTRGSAPGAAIAAARAAAAAGYSRCHPNQCQSLLVCRLTGALTQAPMMTLGDTKSVAAAGHMPQPHQAHRTRTRALVQCHRAARAPRAGRALQGGYGARRLALVCTSAAVSPSLVIRRCRHQLDKHNSVPP